MDIAEAYVRIRPREDPNFKADVGKIAAGAFAGFTAANIGRSVTRDLVGVFRDSVAEQREAVRVGNLTNQVLRTTGAQAGVTAGDVEKLATSLSKVSGVDDEIIQAGANVLLTFRSVHNEVGKGNDVFNQAVKASLDLSAAFGTDLQGTILQVGKALNDPLQGLLALRRVGVSFTEDQQKQIKSLTESGRLLEAQKIILTELRTEFGGAAAAAASPAEKFHVAVKNLEESIGGALVPSLNVAEGGLSAIGNTFTSLPHGVQSTVVSIGTLATGVIAAQIVVSKLAAALEGTALASAASKLGLGSLASVAGSLGEVGIALGVISLGGKELNDQIDKWQHGTPKIKELTSALLDLAHGTTSVGNVTELARGQLGDLDKALAVLVSSGNAEAAKKAIDDLTAGAPAAARQALLDHLTKYKDAVQSAALQQKLSNEAMSTGAQDAKLLAEAVQAAADAYSKRASEAFDTYVGHLVETLQASQSVTSAEGELTDAIKGTGDEATASASKVKTYGDAVSAVFDVVLNADRASLAARKALGSLNDAVKSQAQAAYAAGHNLIRLDGQQASSADDVKSSLLDVIQAREQEVDAEANAGEIANTAAARHQALIDKLLDLRNQYPQLAGDIDRYLTAARKIPELPLDVVAEKTAKKQQSLADATLNVVAALEQQAKADDNPIHGLETMNTQLQALIDKYHNFPSVVAMFQSAVDAAVKAEAQILGIDPDFLKSLLNPATAAAAISALGFTPKSPEEQQAYLRQHPPGRASGGSVIGGLPYWVGEHGPEPFVPATSGTIVSHEDAMAALSGWGGAPLIGTLHVETTGSPQRVLGAAFQEARDHAYLLGKA